MTEKKQEKDTTSSIYVLDWLINKPVQIQGAFSSVPQAKERIVYKDEKGKEMVGTVLGYPVHTSKKGTYLYPLTGSQAKHFATYQDTAADMFIIFKKEFTQAFPTAKAVTARMNLQGNQVYFFFYAETRFDFAEFVKAFRAKIKCRFFLYQVGPRDRVRLHPNLHERYDPNGLPLMYHIFKHPLPNIESDMLEIQGLHGRSAEKMKDWSGKFDHTLGFEADIYKKEMKQYPAKGSVVTINGSPMKCIGVNILTQEIKLRGKTSEKKEKQHDKKKTEKTTANNTKKRSYRENRWGGEFKKISLTEYQTLVSKKTSRQRT